MVILNVTRGADPELFLKNNEGKAISSIGLIGGTKEYPRPIGDGYAVQEDNVAVEFNIPPAFSKQEFVASIHHVLGYLRNEAAGMGLSLNISPTAEFSPDQLLHPQALELGCEPDYNAWTKQVNPRPVAPVSLRSSGGHLHLGWNNPQGDELLSLIKAHDLFCGASSILYDKNTQRRSIYGKAGAFRPKPYGGEYRTLSNFWIASEELTAWVYEQSEKAVAFVNNGFSILEEDVASLLHCINNSDIHSFHFLNEKYGII